MKVTFLLFILALSTSKSSLYSSLKDNVLSYLTKRNSASGSNDENRNQRQDTDERIAKVKAEILNKAKEYEVVRNYITKPVESKVESLKDRYRKDPILNLVGRRSLKKKYSSSETESSSSLEIQNWKDDWKEQWLLKKYEALNSSASKGDSVNMVAARPWGVPCGDPNQHDMPWGTCMLPMECDAEYRIYRGDYFCGRTQFVCCALQLTSYDMYQGFDVSFADSSLATDSYERNTKGRDSRERKRRKKRQDRNRRRRDRLKRKRKMRSNINKIIREIKRILNRSYRNGTAERKKKTKRLKKYISFLKKKYKKDRKHVQHIHNLDLLKTDMALMKKLAEIRNLNKDFLLNSTFRDIIINGTVNREAVQLLLKTYPELEPYLRTSRRSGSGKMSRDYEYDVEYGLLYH